MKSTSALNWCYMGVVCVDGFICGGGWGLRVGGCCLNEKRNVKKKYFKSKSTF